MLRPKVMLYSARDYLSATLAAVLASTAGPLSAQESMDQIVADPAEQASEPVADKPAAMSAAELKEAGGKMPRIVESPEEVPGLEELHARGIQGQSVVELVIEADGTISDRRVVTPSPSPELDQVALGLIDYFVAEPGVDGDGQPVAVIAKLPLSFWKDSIANGSLAEKTCADFVIDADWYLSVNPDGSIKDMRVWPMTVGAFIIGNPAQDIAERFKGAPQPDPDELYKYCSEKPEKKFMRTFKKLG